MMGLALASSSFYRYCCKCYHFPKLVCLHNKKHKTYSGPFHSPFVSLKYQRKKSCMRHPQTRKSDSSEVDDDDNGDEDEKIDKQQSDRKSIQVNKPFQEKENFGILAACFVGLLTGIGVVLFNNTVHEVRDIFWDGIPSRGASWLREEPLQEIWGRVIFVPTCGGIFVAIVNSVRDALDITSEPQSQSQSQSHSQSQSQSQSQSKSRLFRLNVKAGVRPVLKALSASITLGTGNSLGPEGPSVEIGASIAKGINKLFGISNKKRLSLVAAGSAAGISSGFNTAVAGCFFAVESVLWPSPADSSPSLSNTTSMVILSAVIASVISEVGLGSQPAFKVPEYDFRSPSELPLYLLLGILCGLVSLTLSKCTSYALTAAENIHKTIGIPRAIFPVLGGLAVGLIAIAYPEILYWGFENVDILLESRPFVKGLPADLLLQLVGVKIVATSICRASGLVGGYYAPSLFIGAATGMAYGKFASYAISHSDPFFHLSILEVASPQAYGLVGMAATLAGVCQVPLTAVLLLFELTQDYRIVLPLLGAVGLSSLIASGQARKRDDEDQIVSLQAKGDLSQEAQISGSNSSVSSSSSGLAGNAFNSTELCELESSLCLVDAVEAVTEFKQLEERIFVSQAMRIRYVSILMSTLLTETITFMLAEKQSCAVIVDNDNFLIGFLTLADIQKFSELAKEKRGKNEVQRLIVSDMCNGDKCQVLWTVTPDMNIFSAQVIMNRHGVNQLPVVSQHVEDHRRIPVGLLDKECITLTCRAVATKEALMFLSTQEKEVNT